MSEKEIERLKELESTNLSTEDIREEVIKTKKRIEKDNDAIADKINKLLHENNIKSFDIVGAIGAGKTAIIEKIAEKVSNKYRILAICGDITTRLDADRIAAHNSKTIQINTGRECALNAYHIYKIIKNLNLDDLDVIFIENVGNLICPSEFLLGADMRITVVSITEGEWVVEKHPMLFKMSHIAVINKIDLLERLGTNIDKMINDAKTLNPNITVLTTSTKKDVNIDKLIEELGL